MSDAHTHEHDTAKCHAILQDLSLYVDGEAEDALCEEIERHMAGCENCRVVVDTLAKTVSLYREHGHSHMPGEARERLYTALDLSDYLNEH